MNVTNGNYNTPVMYSRKVTPATVERFQNALQSEPWADVYQCVDANRAFNKFNDIFVHHLNNVMPLAPNTIRSKGNNNDWISPGILYSCKAKKRL